MDSLQVLQEMGEYARESDIQDIWILGDLFDKRLLDAPTMRETNIKLKWLASLGIHIYLLPGNHEAHDASGSMYTLEAYEGLVGDITVFDETKEHATSNGWRFRGVPYKMTDEARTSINRIRDELSGADKTVLLLHHSLAGGKIGGWTCPDGLQPEDIAGFTRVFSGHYHTPQIVGEARYLGAPLQHNFGDAGEVRGFWDITFGDDGTTDEQMISHGLAVPMFHRLAWNHSTGEPQFVSEPHELRINDYVEVEVEGTATQIKTSMPVVQEWCKVLTDASIKYCRPRVVLKTERKERARITSSSATGRVVWPAAVTSYVKACDTTGLDGKRLEELGRRFLEEAERDAR